MLHIEEGSHAIRPRITFDQPPAPTAAVADSSLTQKPLQVPSRLFDFSCFPKGSWNVHLAELPAVRCTVFPLQAALASRGPLLARVQVQTVQELSQSVYNTRLKRLGSLKQRATVLKLQPELQT